MTRSHRMQVHRDPGTRFATIGTHHPDRPAEHRQQGDRGPMNKHRIGALFAALALTLTFAGTASRLRTVGRPAAARPRRTARTPCPDDALWIWTGESSHDAAAPLRWRHVARVSHRVNGAWHFIADRPDQRADTAPSSSSPRRGGLLTSRTAARRRRPRRPPTRDDDDRGDHDLPRRPRRPRRPRPPRRRTTSEETTTTDEITTTTTPAGSVEELTPPQTDTIAQPTSSSTVSTSLLLVLAGMLSAALVIAPAAARKRR